uniref:Reverse transcriptase domain-containing protein n=1 Tax=Tanacetum cinerariifolium TaxID=118510 RepID=A0A699JF00_TANCI|nr:reverse transcriptase domain-containing protein [Tanacetum cinerariifolium]
MDPKRTSTSTAHVITQAAIQQLVADSVVVALEAQAANMENADNTNRNSEPREIYAARKCSYKEFMSCQPFNFKGTEGVVSLIHWFEQTESVFSRSSCTEDYKVKFATGTLTKEALSWWNSFAQPIGIEEDYKITWIEFKKLLIKKYCPQTEVHKMKDKFYHMTVKGNDLKTYVRRFQELAALCPTMVSNSEKMMEAFIGGLPRSIEGNVTASKPQTLEEAINIAQRLMDQLTKHNSMQGTNDHKQKFDNRRNTTNENNYHNNHNIDHHHQHNRRQETFKAYVATPTKNRGLVTKWAIRLGTAKSKDFYSQTSLHHPTKSRDGISLRNFFALFHYVTYVGNKMHKAFSLPVMEVPLPEEVPTASEESSHCQKKRDATAMKIALLLKSRRNCQSKSYDSFAKTSTSEARAMTLAAIRQLVVDSVTAALKAQVANMENTNSTNINPKPREALVARKCSYKEFMSCQPFNFKGLKGTVGLIRWFEHT